MLFRQAQIGDLEAIWQIILYAKETMRQRGSQQWQDGYPFRETIEQDIARCYGYVVEEQGEVIAYIVIHRMAVSPKGKGKGLGSYLIQEAEKTAVLKGIGSVRVDTNFDNDVMKHILQKQGYIYCGIIEVRDGKREAFQKSLK